MCDQDHFEDDVKEYEARGLVTRREFGILLGAGMVTFFPRAANAVAVTESDVNVTTPDGTQHRLWRVSSNEVIGKLRPLFAPKRLHVLDGHARYEGMLAYAEKIGADKYTGPGLAIQWVEIEGPLHDTWPPASHKRLFGDLKQEKTPTPEDKNRLEVVSKQPLADANARLAGLPWLSLLVSKLRLLLLAGHGAKGKTIADTHGIFVDGGVTPFNNPTMALLMMTQLKGYGLEIVDRVRIAAPATDDNAGYLETKRTKLGHLLSH